MFMNEIMIWRDSKEQCDDTLNVLQIIEVGFGITVYVYFFVNVDHTQVQQNTGELSRHIYNMRYLMNGIVYTLMVITPISTIIRPILFWLILFKRKLLLSYFVRIKFYLLYSLLVK